MPVSSVCTVCTRRSLFVPSSKVIPIEATGPFCKMRISRLSGIISSGRTVSVMQQRCCRVKVCVSQYVCVLSLTGMSRTPRRPFRLKLWREWSLRDWQFSAVIISYRALSYQSISHTQDLSLIRIVAEDQLSFLLQEDKIGSAGRTHWILFELVGCLG
jgi:hypothetical protein